MSSKLDHNHVTNVNPRILQNFKNNYISLNSFCNKFSVAFRHIYSILLSEFPDSPLKEAHNSLTTNSLYRFSVTLQLVYTHDNFKLEYEATLQDHH
jgi:hypothetical protein